MLVYMYEEWFEKIAAKNNITKVVQTDRLIEIEETSKSMKHNENASSIDEVLNELLNFWDS